MAKPTARILRAVLAGVSAMVLAGCTETVAGVAVRAAQPNNSDGAIVALMNTGNYPTTPGPPFGPAGDGGALFEGERMAEYVVGPWQVDEMLRQPAVLPTLSMPSSTLHDADVLADPLPDIAIAHGYIDGFSTARTSRGLGTQRSLLNLVMRFPDAGAATAAATEMAAKNPQLGDSPGRPVSIGNHPAAAAAAYDALDGRVVVQSFTAYGPYVFYQSAMAKEVNTGLSSEGSAKVLISSALTLQAHTIDRFVPTDPTKLADLPKDPTGRLLALTLWAADGHQPRSSGVWQPIAALHFEDDPVESATLFNTAGVDAVSQRLTKVYRARDAAAAAGLVDRFTADTAATTDVKPGTGVPGLPGARCFTRTADWAASTDPPTLKQAQWHFKCIAWADRYAFMAFSDHETDVKQQISAQYRILAGK